MNVEKLVSIVVPVYQVEEYLERCVDSILDQTYKNIEVILVDDGSVDKSGEICDLFSRRDERIIVVHKKNEGQSAARNDGIKLAKGEYVTFVDSDDFISCDMVKKLVYLIQKYDCEVSACSCYKFYGTNHCIPAKEFVFDEIMDTKIFFKKLILEDEACTVWGKLYKRSIFDKLSFEVGKYHEDELMMLELSKCNIRISWLSENLYYYNQIGSSLTRSAFSYKKLDRIEIEREWLDFSKTISSEIYSLMLKKYVMLLIDTYSELVDLQDKHAKEVRKCLVQEINLLKKMERNSIDLSTMYRFKIVLIKFKIFKWVKRIYKA